MKGCTDIEYTRSLIAYMGKPNAFAGVPLLIGSCKLLQCSVLVYVPCSTARQADVRQRWSSDPDTELLVQNPAYATQLEGIEDLREGDIHCNLQLALGFAPCG